MCTGSRRVLHLWTAIICSFGLLWIAGLAAYLDRPMSHANPLRKGKVNINTCSKRELIKKIPGMTSQKAEEIVRGRPYSNIYELVTKKILTKKELSRIRDFITAKGP